MKNKIGYVVVASLLAIGVLPAAAQNQSYDQFAPKPVIPAPYQAGNTPKSTTRVGGSAGDVLIPNVNGLIFAAEPQEISPSGAKKVSGIVELPDLKLPDKPGFEKVVSKFLNKRLTRGDLNTLITDIILYYRKNDRPVVDVVVPQQEITGGVVQVLVLEGHVGTVTVTGNRWFSPDEVKSGFRAKSGDPIIATDIKSDLEWINQNPFHTSDVIYQPGAANGITNINLETQDRFPARFYAGYEDSGNPETGFDRYLVGLNWGDAWDAGLGHQLNYQYTTSGNFNSLQAHSGSYVIPLPWHHTLTLLGNYIQTDGTIPPYFGISGVSYQASGRYSIPLPRIGDYQQSFGLGFDYKYNHNSLQFGDVPISVSPVEVDQFVMAYDSSLRDDYGITSLDVQVYESPGGGLTNYNTDKAFGESHTYATSDYSYATMQLTRLTRLPGDFSLFLRGEAQFANTNLTQSEQLGFGGYDTVRGYDDREVNKDEGFITNVEIRSPVVGLGPLIGCHEFNDQLQFLVFWDNAIAYNHNLLPGEPTETALSSLGGGARYTINTNLSVRADYGFQLVNTHLDNDHGGRGDLSVVFSY